VSAGYFCSAFQRLIEGKILAPPAIALASIVGLNGLRPLSASVGIHLNPRPVSRGKEAASARAASSPRLTIASSSGDSVGVGPGFAPVVAGSESVSSVSLTNKGAVGFKEFLYGRPETAGKRGKDGFVDKPFLGGVI
jgi:hypothetical protein